MPARASRASPRATTSRAYVDDLGAVIDLDAIRGAGLQARRRPARRREPRLLGGDPRPATGSTSRSSTTSSTRRSASCRSTTTARSAWTARRRSRWRGCATSPTASTSPSPTTRTPTATASSRPAAGLLNPNHHLAACIAYLFGGHRDWGAGRRDRQDARLLVDHRPGRRRPRPPARRGPRRLQVVRRRACSTARSASAGRRAPAPRSCAATARAWSTDKDGLIPCLLAAEMKATTGKDPGEHLRRAASASAGRGLHAHRRRRDAGAEGRAQAALARAGDGDELAGEPITADAHRGARQRRADRRAQGRRGARLVRRAPVGHRGRLQGLRREPRRRRSAWSASSARRRRSSPRRWRS